MRKLILLAAAVLLVAGPGVVRADTQGGLCAAPPSAAGDWPAAGGDLLNSRYQAAESTIDAAAAGSLTKAWAVKVDSGGTTGAVNAAPVEANGCVFVGTAAGRIAALSAADGSEQWHDDVDPLPATAGLGGVIVGSTVVDDGKVFALVNGQVDDSAGSGPYAIALNEHTGKVLWQSKPFATQLGSYTNASPAVMAVKGSSDGEKVLFAGWSPAEGDSAGQGGFALIDTDSGDIVKTTLSLPQADRDKGMAGGGIWSTPAYDAESGFAFVGASNPYSKTQESDYTNAVLKIDLHADNLGAVVGTYKGLVDQYNTTLQTVSQSPACAASDTPTTPTTFDDPVCGQLDLDFGAPPNLFELNGKTVVGALQKAGVYHVFDEDMHGLWQSVVGGPCATCNAAATAVGPDGVAGVATPAGIAFTLDQADGSTRWVAPVNDGVHYEGTTLADGVFYTYDTAGFLDLFDAASGMVINRMPMAADTGEAMTSLTSAGVSVARNTVFVGASGGSPTSLDSWVIAYRAS